MRSLEAELATAGLRANDAERESKSLRATIESNKRDVSFIFLRVLPWDLPHFNETLD